MFVLVVLIVAILIFRGLGVVGVPLFQSWHGAALWGMAVMLLFTASAHFNARKEDLIKMVPRQFPYPRQMVLLTGMLEILGAIGLLVPVTRSAAAICLTLLFVAMLPANIYAALKAMTLWGKPATPLWLRIPMQVFFIALVLWAALL